MPRAPIRGLAALLLAALLVLPGLTARADMIDLTSVTPATEDDPAAVTPLTFGDFGNLSGFFETSDVVFQSVFRTTLPVGARLSVDTALDNDPDSVILFDIVLLGVNGLGDDQEVSFLALSDPFTISNGMAMNSLMTTIGVDYDEVVISVFGEFGEPIEGLPAFTGSYTVAVPEPATWAMMVIGFALVASRLRRPTPAPAL